MSLSSTPSGTSEHINGCDSWFDGTWKSCCDIHDVQFTEGGDLFQFLDSNVDLFNCVMQHDWLNAVLMFGGVTVFGGLFFRWKRLNGKNLWEVLTKWI
jgi:hypothetical protein